jgi:ribonucleoside-diphosphate reductase alpha chain
MLGILTEDGYPVASAGILSVPRRDVPQARSTRSFPARSVPECGNRALIKKDGCEFCTQCGHTGACG